MTKSIAIVDSKKMAFVFVMVCILLLAFPSPVHGRSNPDDFAYTVSDGSASITGYTGTRTFIHIPPLLGGYIVETIDSEALSNKELWEIYIPASVISIGENAFAGNQDSLRLVGESGSAAETYALENGHAFEEKRWTVEKTASHETVSLGTGESATILYTIESTVHSVVDTTSTYDQHLIWNGVGYFWGDADEDDGVVTMSIDGFEIQRPSFSISRLSRGRDESRTDSYELTITNVDAEVGKTFSLGNYAFVFDSDGFPYDWTANLVAVTTPGGDVPEETPDPGEEVVEEEEEAEEIVEEEEEQEEEEEEEEQELPQTGGLANYGFGLLLLAGAFTLIKNRK